MRLFPPLALAAALLLSACATSAPIAKPEPVPAPGVPYDVALKRWQDGQLAYQQWSAKRPGWTTTASGLQYHRIRKASKDAPMPAPGATVTLHYTGTFIDGRVFDSSRERNEPATFPLGRLIKGWQEGVPLMHVGERYEFVIPSSIAYGDRNRDPIPPGSTLLFDIELLAIPPAEAP